MTGKGQWWLQLEMTTPALRDGVTKDLLMSEAKGIAAEVAAHLTAEEYQAVGERVARRWLGARATDKGFQVQSVADLEELVSGIEAQIGTLATVPAGMHPVDLYRRHNELVEASAQLRVAVTEAKQLLARIRTRFGDYLSVTERQLVFGQVNADVFERNRKWVDERLARDAPKILEQFAAAYRRQAEGDAESRSLALTSCRRVLKALADLVYPADGEVVLGIDDRERSPADARPDSPTSMDRCPSSGRPYAPTAVAAGPSWSLASTGRYALAAARNRGPIAVSERPAMG